MTALYIQLIRQYLIGRKGRSLVTLLGIALGVSMVVAVLLTNSAILSHYRNMLAGMAGRADLQVTGASGSGFAQSLLAEAVQTPGVAAVVPAVTATIPAMAGDRKTTATFYGVDPAAEEQVRSYKVTGGRLPIVGREVAISADLAASLGLTVGSDLQLLTTDGMRLLPVVGVFDPGGTARGALGEFGILPLSTAQAWFGKGDRLDVADLVLTPGASAVVVQERLRERLGSSAQVGKPAEKGRELTRLLDSLSFMLTLAGSISLFAGAFIIYTNVMMAVAERRRQIAILRALGMRRREVMTLVLGEAGLMGVGGAILGLGLGWGLSSTMVQQMTGQMLASYGIQSASVRVDGLTLAVAIMVGLGAALLAAYGPAMEAVQVSPTESMRPDAHSSAARERRVWWRLVAGAAIMAGSALFIVLTWPEEGMLPHWLLQLWGLSVGVFLMGVVLLLPGVLLLLNRSLFGPLFTGLLGTSGRLAAANLRRQERRMTATVAALMVTLAFMVAIGGVAASQRAAFADWYNNLIGWDLHVSTSFSGLTAQMSMEPSFGDALSRIEGVRLVSPQKFTYAELAGEPILLQVIDTPTMRPWAKPLLEEGEWQGAYDTLERGGAALISASLGQRLGLHVGDRIELPTPDGVAAVTVAGVFMDVSPTGGTLMLDWQDYRRYWHDDHPSSFAVLVDKGADPAAIRQRISDQLGNATPLRIRLNREFWAELQSQYDGFYRLMDGLILIAVLVAGLAIANTLFAAILERRSELAMLRAIGSRRSEVIRLVAGEALGIGIVGAVAGIPAGLAIQTAMSSATVLISGFESKLTIAWGSLGLACLVALLFAPLAGLLPARWAARQDPVEGLRYE